MEKKKMGRPTNNPKRHHMSMKLDDEAFTILQTYCSERPDISRNEAINRGIKYLKHSLKKTNK